MATAIAFSRVPLSLTPSWDRCWPSRRGARPAKRAADGVQAVLYLVVEPPPGDARLTGRRLDSTTRFRTQSPREPTQGMKVPG
jgi:hypothetical protein